MSTRFRVLIGLGFAVGIAGLAVAYFMLDASTYDVKGRVAGIDDGGETLVVEHEEIPGVMPPMIMPLPVADPDMTASLEPDDAISVTMRVSGDSTWIAAVQSIPDTAVARNPAQTVTPLGDGADGETPMLEEGDRVPADLTLRDQNGNRIRMADFRGRALALTFIYTDCPLPDFCPLMSKRFATLQPTLRERFGDQAHLLSVSFDPATDTPAVLRAYAAEYTDRLDTWTFATGDTSQVKRATRLFGVYTQPEEGEITHNLVTAVIRPDGTVRRLFRGNEWTPDDITQTMEEIL